MHTKPEAEQINKMAREVFMRDGYHPPVVILDKAGQRAVLPAKDFMNENGGKDALAGIIRFSIKMMGVSGVALIMEAWVHKAQGENGHLAERLANGEISMSDLRPEEKEECLMVNVESDDGLRIMFVNLIVRDAKGKPSLKEPDVKMTGFVGRFGGFFKNEPLKLVAEKR